MHAWAKGLSREVGKHGITVNSIPPGRIMSEQIRRNYPRGIPQMAVRRERDPGRLLRRARGSRGDRVCFLASPLARYITGTVIPVDGGLRRYQF